MLVLDISVSVSFILLIYIGFVTGGTTPAALLADYLVSTYDQNVQVHLPQSISTTVERQTIRMLCELLDLPGFDGTLTTGATAGNILGLACGKESTIVKLNWRSPAIYGAGEGAVRVFHASGHSSISKASSIVGIGRAWCSDVTSKSYPPSFDYMELKRQLKEAQDNKIATIVVETVGEVNTGTIKVDFVTIAGLCKRYDAWLHVDAAFGILARIHPDKKECVRHLELADSISFDAHKFFNVPYDCGVFLTRHIKTLRTVCWNAGADYLGSSNSFDDDPSPLDISLENSRRFRALPLYASLLSLGAQGYERLAVRCCNLAWGIGQMIKKSDEFSLVWGVEFNIVLFQAVGYDSKEENNRLRDEINRRGKLYLSSTVFRNQPALRIAVCSHLTPEDEEKEADQILTFLKEAKNHLDAQKDEPQ
jgi:glutamate/tyrosine decarboxylase-like PLP-dependent enzyme